MLFDLGNYNKDSLVEAFVKFLENESQPKPENDNSPALLNIVHAAPPSRKQSTNTDIHNASSSSLDSTNESAKPTAAVQPIQLSDAVFQTFSSSRNSSSILKDILSDS